SWRRRRIYLAGGAARLLGNRALAGASDECLGLGGELAIEDRKERAGRNHNAHCKDAFPVGALPRKSLGVFRSNDSAVLMDRRIDRRVAHCRGRGRDIKMERMS